MSAFRLCCALFFGATTIAAADIGEVDPLGKGGLGPRATKELYMDAAAGWAETLARASICTGQTNLDKLEAEASAASIAIAPGLIAWLSGSQRERKEEIMLHLRFHYEAGLSGFDCMPFALQLLPKWEFQMIALRERLAK